MGVSIIYCPSILYQKGGHEKAKSMMKFELSKEIEMLNLRFANGVLVRIEKIDPNAATLPHAVVVSILAQGI